MSVTMHMADVVNSLIITILWDSHTEHWACAKTFLSNVNVNPNKSVWVKATFVWKNISLAHVQSSYNLRTYKVLSQLFWVLCQQFNRGGFSETPLAVRVLEHVWGSTGLLRVSVHMSVIWYSDWYTGEGQNHIHHGAFCFCFENRRLSHCQSCVDCLVDQQVTFAAPETVLFLSLPEQRLQSSTGREMNQ